MINIGKFLDINESALRRIANWQTIDAFELDTAYKDVDAFVSHARDIARHEVRFGMGGLSSPKGNFTEVMVVSLDQTLPITANEKAKHPALFFLFSMLSPVVAVGKGEVSFLEGGVSSISAIQPKDLVGREVFDESFAFRRLALALDSTSYKVLPPNFFRGKAPAWFKPSYDTLGFGDQDTVFDLFFQIIWGE